MSETVSSSTRILFSAVCARKQSALNKNAATEPAFQGVLEYVQKTKKAILTNPVYKHEDKDRVAASLALSQYRHDVQPYLNDPLTFLAYPVFDSFSKDRKIAGILTTKIYWRYVCFCLVLDYIVAMTLSCYCYSLSRLYHPYSSSDPRRYFMGLLPPSAIGYVVVLKYALNDGFAYRIDGKDVTYLGQGDPHDPSFDDLAMYADINDYVQKSAGPQTRAYTTVPLGFQDDGLGHYQLYVYPTTETKESFVTAKPWVYCGAVLATFFLTAFFLVLLDRVIAKRQRIVMERLVRSANSEKEFEKELNSFVAHEVRK